MTDYHFDNNEFIIEQYDKKKTFSSFLPGMAGKRGIPLWAFYVNRGQGIASFGIENKDRQILEFSPAVKAYQTVGTDGFRTFVKIDGKTHELFAENDDHTTRRLRIKRSEFTIEETNHDLNLKTTVTYFGLPNRNIAALVRVVNITNLNDEPIAFELIDGLSQLLPTGVSQHSMKMLTNLMRSWMEVYRLDDNVGFYRMRSSSADTAEVVEIEDGNFYLSSVNGELQRPIVDQRLVFGTDTTKRRARHFEQTSLKDICDSEQVTANKIPVGFTALDVALNAGETVRINTLIGHIHCPDYLVEIAPAISSDDAVDKARLDAALVIDELLDEVATKTAFPIFDDYIKQNYLDNMLRGGYPMIIEGSDKNFVYHLFSRRHGDLERDYNYFTIAPEFYSQGNGSFRDVCQNRRSDTLLNPLVGDFNMKMFGSLIQADGFNPLSIDGSTFAIADKQQARDLAAELFGGDATMTALLMNSFTPGSIINTMANHNITSDLSDDELFARIFAHAEQRFEAHFAEGYWIDHWTYILDLVENFEAIYPDQMEHALFNDVTYKYFDSPIYVLPRDEKICLTADGKVRRYGSLLHNDEEKIRRLGLNPNRAHWLQSETGATVYGSLYEKLLVLAVNKIASLDPSGIGIEMEADKPGWNDAMNGLPGLFGSGVSETIELKRVVRFLLSHFDASVSFKLPAEFIAFMKDLASALDAITDDFHFWQKINDAKEAYRAAIRFHTSGLEYSDSDAILSLLEAMDHKIDHALTKAHRLGNGIYPTYLVHDVTAYEPVIQRGKPHIGNYGLPTVRPTQFKLRALPFYLEAPARALKVMKSHNTKESMFRRIKASNIYDHELKFYKTSEFLDAESNEIGRGRSFTKGWQERESNFLHMTYKYLLGLLKAGLYQEFFEEIKTNLTIFMDPAVYGRSTLENSSFIASSINPDPFVRGQGYVARLSGSTAEMLSIWALMMYGKQPFVMDGNELTLQLRPILTKEFFADGTVTFTFLGTIRVTYHNESRIDTFDPDFAIDRYVVDGKEVDTIRGSLAEAVRNRTVKTIDIYF